MFTLPNLYRQSLVLLTDLYQLTMAQGYWKVGRAEESAAFHLSFRRNPFRGGFALAAGLGYLLDLRDSLRFTRDDLDYLATLTGNDGLPLFDRSFLDYLGKLPFACDIDAMPEGTLAFPHEPLVRVIGPMLQCQLLETFLLNVLNFQSLIATKAARVCMAAEGDAVLEFGLRRAQGIDGGLAASRAAYLGGCAATSNVLAGKLFGIPVRGTHAHSWVMSFESEQEAFDAYAGAMPNNCVFLVDTYDTLRGVRRAIETGRRLRDSGRRMIGVRLDSGDLAWMSIEARKLLDEAGFHDAVIVGSNDLDEHLIADLKRQGATIAVWGVGTNLVTASDQPALGGVYKLGAIYDAAGGAWRPRIKVSEQPAKTTVPGVLQVRRFSDAGGFVGDMIYDESVVGPPGADAPRILVDPADASRQKGIAAGAAARDLLVPVYRGGELVYDVPTLQQSRERAAEELRMLHPAVRQFMNPHAYPVGLEVNLHRLRGELIARARRDEPANAEGLELTTSPKSAENGGVS